MTVRRRLVLGAVAAAAALAVVLLLVTRGPSAPSVRADRLVPADALLYVHASTDPDREQDRRMLELLERLAVTRTLRDRLEATAGDVRPWLGDEAAVAVTPRGTLALLAVDDEDRARAAQRRLRGIGSAFIDDFLVLGSKGDVDRVRALAAGRGAALAEEQTFERLAAQRPEDRVLDVWAGRGARSLGGAVAERLPDAPALATVTPSDGTLRLRARVTSVVGRGFLPRIPAAVPADAVGYLGLRSLQPLVDLLPRPTEAATDFIDALGPLVRALDLEAGLVVSPADPEPVFTIAGRTSDPDGARAALGSLQGVVAQLLVGTEADTGLVPTFEERDLGEGLTGFALRLAGGGELVTGVRGDRIAVSNAVDGVRQALTGEDGITAEEPFRRLVGEPPESAQLLLFLDLSRLLDIGERAGLTGLQGYQAARGDARKLRAAGAVVLRRSNDTTVELNLQIR